MCCVCYWPFENSFPSEKNVGVLSDVWKENGCQQISKPINLAVDRRSRIRMLFFASGRSRRRSRVRVLFFTRGRSRWQCSVCVVHWSGGKGVWGGGKPPPLMYCGETYVLAKKCLKEWIGNQGHKVHILGSRHISTSGFAATATKTAVFALFLLV